MDEKEKTNKRANINSTENFPNNNKINIISGNQL